MPDGKIIELKVKKGISKQELLDKLKKELDAEFPTAVVDKNASIHISLVNFVSNQ
jgi:hypothetical protein